tara:strand:+ start:11458 stop:12465 length:1008 start_codon:yes stop_codon:yes gene_type:complete
MLDSIQKEVLNVSKFIPKSEKELNDFKIKYLGKKGILNSFFSLFKDVPVDKKKEFGVAINNFKKLVQEKIDDYKNSFVKKEGLNDFDLTKPVSLNNLGSRHPISITRNKIVNIFKSVGFTLSDGPEVEDDWHNFSALNLPENHPARDMQDTFFIQRDPDFLLRTHTSSVQVRYMQKSQPPIRILSPGRVYRNESISARSHCIFHQIEGLYVDTDVNFADLKQILLYFVKEMFGENSKIRFRPSFFPFTEPSAEVDIYWGLKNESDYRITKGTGWLEILGCGMVDPNVLENCGINSEKYTGYAFGMGIERIAMLINEITDLRLFYENDIRFLKQFN